MKEIKFTTGYRLFVCIVLHIFPYQVYAMPTALIYYAFSTGSDHREHAGAEYPVYI